MGHAAARFSVFVGLQLVGRGGLLAAATAAHACGQDLPLVLDDASGQPVDLNLQGSASDVASRYAPEQPPPKVSRGRPKLGVVAREVTLLPRHWDWLSGQSGGASAALRRLVDQARRADGGATELRATQERVYQAMTALCGDLPGYEEATRALFAADHDRFGKLIKPWPRDVELYLLDLGS